MAETIKQQIEQLPRPSVNLEVVSDEEYAKRIQDGTWELTLMSMNGTDDAGTFADPDSIFHYNHAEVQQAYADARAATNDAADRILGCRGSAVFHNVDLWRRALPANGDPMWSFWPFGQAWMCRNL